MIAYVDLEHDRLRQNPPLWKHFSTKTLETKYRLEAISGDNCLIVHYKRLTVSLLYELNIRAVVIGGQYTALPYYGAAELAGLRSIFKEASWPTIGLCGGLQLLAQTYGADFGPMESLNDDSFPETPTPPDESGLSEAPKQLVKQERGFMPVKVLQSHPLLEGLGPEPVFFQLHSWEVKSLPDEFWLLAESPLCKVQIIAHKEAPLFGVQFHPEQYNDTYPAGRKILENFFKVAGVTA